MEVLVDDPSPSNQLWYTSRKKVFCFFSALLSPVSTYTLIKTAMFLESGLLFPSFTNLLCQLISITVPPNCLCCCVFYLKKDSLKEGKGGHSDSVLDSRQLTHAVSLCREPSIAEENISTVRSSHRDMGTLHYSYATKAVPQKNLN